jgi:hypothetical protein
MSGNMTMRSMLDDEHVKVSVPRACCYCGCRSELTLDHLIPRIKGGTDEADNLVLACRRCNSSKQGRDLLVWAASRGFFPSVLLLRRYVKLVTRYCEEHGILDLDLNSIDTSTAPFDPRLLPINFPPLPELKLWVSAER